MIATAAGIVREVGSEPGYRRPFVIVQDDAFTRSRIGTVVAVAVTSIALYVSYAMPIAAGGHSRGRWFYAVLLVTAGVAGFPSVSPVYSISYS